MNERRRDIVMDIVDTVRSVLRDKEVTFDEYRAGFFHLIKTGECNEIGLLLDIVRDAAE
ncbi:MAG: dioxygenase [Gammaproteobacteria bacterium]|nr:dioxygenase [Gammaproteobacteria bacterium]